MDFGHIREAEHADVPAMARIWHEGWHDAHAAIVPEALTRLRTLESFTPRLERMLEDIRVFGPLGDPVAFCAIRENEVYQLYVTAEARGAGLAERLLVNAESRIERDKHYHTAWLACGIGNERAARFYERCDWVRKGTMESMVETEAGPFPLTVWRYEKSLWLHPFRCGLDLSLVVDPVDRGETPTGG